MLECVSVYAKAKNFLLSEAKTKILKSTTGEMASKRTALTVVWQSTALLWRLIAGGIRRGISLFGSKHGWWRAVDSTRQSGDSQTGRWAAELQIWQQHVWARNSDLWGRLQAHRPKLFQQGAVPWIAGWTQASRRQSWRLRWRDCTSLPPRRNWTKLSFDYCKWHWGILTRDNGTSLFCVSPFFSCLTL